MASAAVDVLPAEPPTWERARALATHARTVLSEIGTEEARVRAEEAAEAASAADAPWVGADALATLSGVSERTGCIAGGAGHQRQGGGAGRELGDGRRGAAGPDPAGPGPAGARVTCRAPAAPRTPGVRLAERTGLSMAPFGLDLQFLHYLAHYADGDWDHAQQIADRFPVRVAGVAEARLSAMALFIDVARGGPRVAERRRWLEPYLPADLMAEYIAKGLYAEEDYWAGDLAAAVQTAWETIKAAADLGRGLSAADDPAGRGRHRRARRPGPARPRPPVTPTRPDAFAADALELLEAARAGAASKLGIGIDGRGWLARAEAE